VSDSRLSRNMLPCFQGHYRSARLHTDRSGKVNPAIQYINELAMCTYLLALAYIFTACTDYTLFIIIITIKDTASLYPHYVLFFDMAMIICTCIHWEESIILLAESSMRLRASYVLWSSWVQQIHSSKELSDYGWWVNELRVLELRRPCRIHTALHSKERWQMLLGLRLVACSTLTNAVLMHPTISNHFGIWDG